MLNVVWVVLGVAGSAPSHPLLTQRLALDPVLVHELVAQVGGDETGSTVPPPEATGMQTALDQARRISNVLDGPSPTLAFTNFLWALGSTMRANNATAGTLRAFTNAFYYAGMLGLPLSYVLPYFTESPDYDPDYVFAGKVYTQVYLLDFKKESALTGSLRREPSGRGLGWDLGGEFPIVKEYGLLWGMGTIYQQTKIDSNDWASIYNMFWKVDLYAGFNAFAFLGHLIGWNWLARQELSARVGPTYFKSWVGIADEGSSWFADPSDRIGQRAGIMSAKGYEVSAVGAIDFGVLGGILVSYQRGNYPYITFNAGGPSSAALLQLVGFDDLRQGTYTWERLRTEVSVPLTGYARSGAINIAGALSKYQSSKGSSVSNRGFSLGGSWRF